MAAWAELSKKEQIQYMVLGGILLFLVGYVGFQVLGGSPPPPPPPKKPAVSAAAVPQQPVLDPQTQVLVSSLPPAYNADPFKPAVVPVGDSRPAPPPPPPPVRRPPAQNYGGPRLQWPGSVRVEPGRPGGPAPSQPGPAVPQPPDRPVVTVSGVIESAKGEDMALVMVGADNRLVKVGDLVEKGYKVAEINLDGIWLASGKDRFFVSLASTPTGAYGEAPGTALPAAPRN